MNKFVLDVGNCGPDHAAVRRLIATHFPGIDVVQADAADDALAILHEQPAALVLVNRKLDRDYSEGLDVIKAIKADPAVSSVPVLLLSNYPEYQRDAEAAGAAPGFGKLEYGSPATIEKLRRHLQ